MTKRNLLALLFRFLHFCILVLNIVVIQPYAYVNHVDNVYGLFQS